MEHISLRARVGTVRQFSVRRAPVIFMLMATLLVLLAVNVVRRDVVLTVAGESQVISTFSHTVAELLDEAGIEVGQADFLSVELEQQLQRGMVIELNRAFPVTVQVDGQAHVHVAAEGTVADALSQLDVELGEMDRVEPEMEQLLEPGAHIDVIRVSRQLVTEKTELPFREIRLSNPDLDRGETRVLSVGEVGVREDTVEIILEDGVEVSVKVVHSEMIRAKQDHVVESGENTVLSRGGRSVNFERVFTMSATAYCAGTAESGCPINANGGSQCTGQQSDGITASGRKARAGSGSENNPHLVAVDRRVIPLGSQLYIDGYGFAIAADTGGAIVGKKIDLLLGTHEEALRFGRRNLRVYLLP